MKKKHPLMLRYSLALSLSALSWLAGTAQTAWAEETAAAEATAPAAEVQAVQPEAVVAQAPVAPAEPAEEVIATFSPTETDPAAAPVPAAEFAPESNPALHTHFGWGRFRLPPSLELDIGSNIPISKAIGDIQKLQTAFAPLGRALQSGSLSAQESQALNTSLNDVLTTFERGARIDYDLDVGLLGFMGSPVGALQIGGRNLTLGLNIGGGSRGYVNVNISPETSQSLKDLSKSVPDVISLSAQVSGLSSQASSLTQSAASASNLATSVAGIFTNPNALTTTAGITQTVSDLDRAIAELDNLIAPAASITTSAKTALNTGDQVVSTANKVTQGGLSIDTVVDGHLTFGLSGSYPVYEASGLRVSVGTNLKMFVLPFNPNLQTLGLAGADSTLLGRTRLDRFTAGTQGFSGIQGVINNLRPVVTDMEKLVTDANTLKTDLTTVRNTLDANKNNPAGLLTNQQFLTDAQRVGTTTTTLFGNITTITTSANSALSSSGNVQQAFQSDLANVKLQGTVVNPTGAGFGVDVGVDAVINENLWLGLLLQNPVVLWPATEKPFTVATNGQFTVDNVNKKSANYNLSEPFAAILGGRYSFDKVLPHKGLAAWGEFELVTNGRMPGLTLGAQQQLGPAYLGLGGRIGSNTSLIFAQAGLRTLGPFGLDFTAGVSPTLSGGLANLGLYLQF